MSTGTKQRTFTQENAMTATAIATRDDNPTPLGLLQQAIDQGLDADKLEKLMALQERWQDRQAEQAFNEAMNACQAEMPVVVRDRKNTQTGSMYATIEAVHERIKPTYLKHGFSLSHGTADSPLEGHYRCVCDVMHIGGHSRRYFLDLPADDRGIKGTINKTPVQAIGSTLSYGQRYLECRIFNLTIADQDNDGQRDQPVVTEEQAVQIQEWIDSKGVNPTRFLEWAGVDSVYKIPANKYQQAIEFLKRK